MKYTIELTSDEERAVLRQEKESLGYVSIAGMLRERGLTAHEVIEAWLDCVIRARISGTR